MGRNVESLSCKVDGSLVRVYDERGNTLDLLSFEYVENAYSTGRGIVVETETMCYTYVLQGNRLVRSGVRARSGSSKRKLADDSAVQCGRQSRSTNYAPPDADVDIGDSNDKSSNLGCVVVAALTVFAFLFYGSEDKSNCREQPRPSRNVVEQNQKVNSSTCWWTTSSDRSMRTLHCRGEIYSDNTRRATELQVVEGMANGGLVKCLVVTLDVPKNGKIKVVVGNDTEFEKVTYWSAIANGKGMSYDGDADELIGTAFVGDRVSLGLKDRNGNFVMATFNAKEFMRAYSAL